MLTFFSPSFLDYHLVADAKVVVTSVALNAAGEHQGADKRETLWPRRHEISLPLNNINIFFDDFNVTFNQHTNLNCDR